MYVHLSYTLCVVAGFGKLSCHGVWVIPGYSVHVSYTFMVCRFHSCMKPCPCGNAAWAGTVGMIKGYATTGKSVQIRCFYIGMSCKSHTVSPKLICHDQKNIWSFFHFFQPPFSLCDNDGKYSSIKGV